MAALLALSGCPADLANPSRFDQAAGANSGTSGGAAVDTSCLSDAFTVCVPCHKSGASMAQGADLDLQSDGVAARLVNVAAKHEDTTGTCPAAKLIDTTTPDASWLLAKVKGTQGTCGAAMPLVGNPLTAMQLACLQKFVTDEAAALGGGSVGPNGATGSSGAPSSARSTATDSSGATGSSGATSSSGAPGSAGSSGALSSAGSGATAGSSGATASGGAAGTSGANAAGSNGSGGSSGSSSLAGTAGASGSNASGTGGT